MAVLLSLRYFGVMAAVVVTVGAKASLGYFAHITWRAARPKVIAAYPWAARVDAWVGAQLTLLNSATPNVYFASTLQKWEQGQFIHFYGLSQWVGWLWPFAVLAWLLVQLLKPAPKPKIAP